MVSSLLFRERTPRDLAFFPSSCLRGGQDIAIFFPPRCTKEGRYRWIAVKRLDYFQFIFSNALFAGIPFLLSKERERERGKNLEFIFRIIARDNLRDSLISRDSIVILRQQLISFIWNYVGLFVVEKCSRNMKIL